MLQEHKVEEIVSNCAACEQLKVIKANNFTAEISRVSALWLWELGFDATQRSIPIIM